MIFFLVACKPDPVPSTDIGDTVDTSEPTSAPVLLSGPEIAPPLSDTVRLAWRVLATTDRPTRATLVLDDGTRRREIAFSTLDTTHDLPLLALRADTAWTVEATFTDAAGAPVTETVGFATGSLDGLPLPELELVHAEPDRSEPGYTLFPAEIGSASHVVAADAEGSIVGTWDTRGLSTRALSFDDGAFASLVGDVISRWTPIGGVLGTWAGPSLDVEGAIALPFDGVHHELAFAPDGSFWTFHKIEVDVDDYPTTEADPSVTGPARLVVDVVLHVAADGTLLHEWSLLDRLDPNRIGYGSVDPGPEPSDWAHANAIAPLDDGSGVLVSLRHQDAVVKLALPDGRLEWILGNPDGWDAAFLPYLLAPVGTLAWPYHQHAPMVGPDGSITLFDNGNNRRTTPYSQDPEPGGPYTRIVRYEVDEVGKTVTQTFESFGTQAPGGGYRLYSHALGNADVLPTTGNLFATFAYLHQENGVINEDIGRGDKSVRLIEVDPETGDTVWDLRLFTYGVGSDGLLTDRAIRVPSLYGAGVTERWLP